MKSGSLVVIGLVGGAGVGKDSLADYAVKELSARGKIGVADYLKKICAEIYKVEIEKFYKAKDVALQIPVRVKGSQVRKVFDFTRQDLHEDILPLKLYDPHRTGVQDYVDRICKTPREVLVYTGQNILKPHCPQYLALQVVQKIRAEGGVWIVPDVRMKMDHEIFKSAFAHYYTIKVTRPGAVSPNNDATETEWKEIPCFAEIVNDSDLDGLYVKAIDVFKKINDDAKERLGDKKNQQQPQQFQSQKPPAKKLW